MKIINKKARFNYELLDRLEAGIVLTGPEVKSVKLGHLSLTESYVRILDNQLFLLNAQINPYKFADNQDYDPKRTRKLLVSKKQLIHLSQKIDSLIKSSEELMVKALSSSVCNCAPSSVKESFTLSIPQDSSLIA